MNEPKDLLLRKVYTKHGIGVVVEIDLVAKKLSLVEEKGNWQAKKWVFAERELEYMNGWLFILDAMKHAITEASKYLKDAKDRDQDEFVNMLIHLNDSLDKKGGKS